MVDRADPAVAVVVSTRDRADRLPRLVAALERQRLDEPFEVVLTDDGSRDDTSRVLDELAQRCDLRLMVRRHDRSRGPAAGRNTGWRATSAPVVAFTDDDCVPQPTWLAEGLAAIRDEPALVVGRTLAAPDQAHRDGPFSRTIEIHGVRFYETCNIFYRREDLAAVGGFDERFTRPGGEDIDLAYRVLARGASPIFAGDAVVHHDVRPSSFRLAAREAARWTGVPLFFRKHPDARGAYLVRGLFWKRSHERVLLAVLGLALTPRLPLAAVLTWPWVRMRLLGGSLSPDPRERLRAAPGAFVVDLIEVVTMLRGSLTHRTLVI